MEPDLAQIDEDIVERFWELYVNYCNQRNEHPSLRDFFVWWEERYI